MTTRPQMGRGVSATITPKHNPAGHPRPMAQAGPLRGLPFLATCMDCDTTSARAVEWTRAPLVCSYCNGEDFTFKVPDIGTPVRQLPSVNRRRQSRPPRQLVVVGFTRDGRRLNVEPEDGGKGFSIIYRNSCGRWKMPRDSDHKGLQFHVGGTGPALPIDPETLNVEEIA